MNQRIHLSIQVSCTKKVSSTKNVRPFLVQSFFETLQYCDEWRKFTSVIQSSVIHSVNSGGGGGVPDSPDVRISLIDRHPYKV